MVETSGRQRKLSGTDILDLLEELPEPFITSREIAEKYDCSQVTAQKRLNTLESKELLAAKTVGARSKVWYRPDWDHRTTDEVIIAFPARHEVIVSNPTSETLDVLESIGTRLAQQHSHHLFSLANPDFGTFDYTSETALREDLETVLAGYDNLISDLIDRWWNLSGTVFRTSDDYADPVVETRTETETADLRAELSAGSVLATPSPTLTVISDDKVLDAINTAQKLGRVSDYRDIRRKRQEYIAPVLNGSIPELPTNVQIIGVDDTPAVHAFEWVSRTIYVIEDEQVTFQTTLAEGESPKDWVEHITNKTDREWVEIQLG